MRYAGKKIGTRKAPVNPTRRKGQSTAGMGRKQTLAGRIRHGTRLAIVALEKWICNALFRWTENVNNGLRWVAAREVGVTSPLGFHIALR